MKHKMDSAIRNGLESDSFTCNEIAESQTAQHYGLPRGYASRNDAMAGHSKAQKSLKTKVKEAIHNAQVERHREDNWELPMDTNNNAERIDDWDILQKLAQ